MTSPVEHIVDEKAGRLDLFLSRKTGESRSFVKYQIQSGCVTVNSRLIDKPSHTVHAGDRVETRFQEEARSTLAPVAGNLDILFEDEHLLVLNKPQDLVVHPAAGHRGETLVHYLLHHLRQSPGFDTLSPARPGIVHRLDRGTSGVLIVAKHRKAVEEISRQFKARETEKEYEAVVWGRLKERGRFTGTIGRDTRDRKKMSTRTVKGREALTRWERTHLFRPFSLVGLHPHTGRTHQLRVHLSEAGHPIVGDALYGKKSRARRVDLPPEVNQAVESLGATLLHARRLSLTHPVSGERLSFTAARPAAFDNFLTLLEEKDR